MIVDTRTGRPERLAVIGAPSSAGAYAPGQERAPRALRDAGLLDLLARSLPLRDYGDAPTWRWRIDAANRRAMNAAAVAATARATATRVHQALLDDAGPVLVLGGDCTVEIGTVAGFLQHTDSIGLIYIDLDTDLNTPESTTDGALDWMGVAHMLALEGTVPEVCAVGSRVPLLRPDQVLYFAIGNVEPFEERTIAALGIEQLRLGEVQVAPARAAERAIDGWARKFERLLIHLDVDVLDFARMPLAENVRRNVGLEFDQLMQALAALVSAPAFSALSVCELNPDHGDEDGSTLREFSAALAGTLARAPRWHRPS
jgi:arginase